MRVYVSVYVCVCMSVYGRKDNIPAMEEIKGLVKGILNTQKGWLVNVYKNWVKHIVPVGGGAVGHSLFWKHAIFPIHFMSLLVALKGNTSDKSAVISNVIPPHYWWLLRNDPKARLQWCTNRFSTSLAFEYAFLDAILSLHISNNRTSSIGLWAPVAGLLCNTFDTI